MRDGVILVVSIFSLLHNFTATKTIHHLRSYKQIVSNVAQIRMRTDKLNNLLSIIFSQERAGMRIQSHSAGSIYHI